MGEYLWPANIMRNNGSIHFSPFYSEAYFARRFSMPKSISKKLFSKLVSTLPFFLKGLKQNFEGKETAFATEKGYYRNILAFLRNWCTFQL